MKNQILHGYIYVSVNFEVIYDEIILRACILINLYMTGSKAKKRRKCWRKLNSMQQKPLKQQELWV